MGKTVLICLLAAQLLGWITFARAADVPSATAPAAPPPNALSNIRRALREFDRFLDHHPLLEDRLRVSPELVSQPEFLRQNPELKDFLAVNSNIRPGLKVYPRYFTYRALLRQANAPLRYIEIAQLKDLFEANPPIERALVENPELIRDPAFVAAQPALQEFLTQRPTLLQVFAASRPPLSPPP